jgi:hypothetical protein
MIHLPDEDKLNFLVGVHVGFGDVLTGGVVAMHKLAHNLAKTGHNVFMFCQPEYPHENIKVINSQAKKLNDHETQWTWEVFHYPLNKTISIYPQIIRGNPYNTQHVSRWILYHTERPIEELYGENDVYFNYGNFMTYKNVPDRKLTVFNYYFEKLFVTNHGKRKGFCHLGHKNTPPNGNEIFKSFGSEDLGSWKTLGCHDYLREKFNQYEYFLTFDQKSFFTLAATLCGCKAIVLNPGPAHEYSPNAFSESDEYGKTYTPTEYRLKNPIQMYGVAYGLDDIGWANKTIEFARDHLQELEIIDNKTVTDFVSFWEKKCELI